MSFTWPFLLCHVYIQTALPCSSGYHLKTGGMPLHDAVGVNCEKGATTENQGPDVLVYLQRGVCLMIVCVCYLT